MLEYSQMPLKEDSSLTVMYSKAVDTIKDAILNAQYEAARGVNSIQLMLYYGIGRYLSHNTRQGKWGTDAIGTISRMLKADMPGLRGYSETTLKRMRIFYEAWIELDATLGVDNSSIQMDEMGKEGQVFAQMIESQLFRKSSIEMDEIVVSRSTSLHWMHSLPTTSAV